MPRKPGLKLLTSKIEEAKTAFKLKGLSQYKLGEKVGVTRGVIIRFLEGKSISNENFKLICEQLDLNIEEVADLGNNHEDFRQFSIRETELIKKENNDNQTFLNHQENPFGDKGKITNPERFFDRENIIGEIFAELKKGGNISLVGESQVGKSSILAMICQWGTKVLNIPSNSFLYLDLQNIHNEAEFFEELCDEELLNIETCRGNKLKRQLKNKCYILCIDEIEKMLNQNNFSKDIRSELRGLAEGSDAPLSLVIASRSHLKDLFPDSPIETSPLAGICNRIEVLPFSPQIAKDFIYHRLTNHPLTFDDAQITAIIEKTNGHPAQLQSECAQLYRQLLQASNP